VLDRERLKKLKEKDDVIREIVLSLRGKIGGGEERLTVEEGKLRKVRGIVKDKSDAIKRRPVRKKRGEIIPGGIVMIDDRKGGGITVVKKDGRRGKRGRDEKEIGERRSIIGNRGKDKRKRMQCIMSHSIRIHYV
jgi:hypothetical protein